MSAHPFVREFDLATHHRNRTRKAEQRAEHLERHTRKLERLLGTALVAAAGSDASPLALLAVIEEVDAVKCGPTVDEITVLLRETAP